MNEAALQTNRQDTILNAAFQAFAAYGYKRTSMDDIAQSAGLSRTALYLHFRSKDDIFRSLAQRHFEQAQDQMATALATPGLTMEQALYACFVAKDGKFMDAVLSTPHGAELLDAGGAVSLDLVVAGEAAMVAQIATWLDARGVPPSLAPAQAVAETIFAALKGLKFTARTITDLRAGERHLATLIARAFAPGP